MYPVIFPRVHCPGVFSTLALWAHLTSRHTTPTGVGTTTIAVHVQHCVSRAECHLIALLNCIFQASICFFQFEVPVSSSFHTSPVMTFPRDIWTLDILGYHIIIG